MINNLEVYDKETGTMIDNPALPIIMSMYKGTTTSLGEYFDTLQAPPLCSILTDYDIAEIRKIVTSVRLAGNVHRRLFGINEILAKRGLVKLAGGTNRVVYSHPMYPNIVIKIALDRVGMKDNPSEYYVQNLLKPFCTKIFEITEDGLIAVAEKVERVRNIKEYTEMSDDIYSLYLYFVKEKGLVMEDIGVKFFMNWGNRPMFGPVILDFPYCYEIDPKKLHCKNVDEYGRICNGEIDYDDCFNFLVCKRCGKIHRALEISKGRFEEAIADSKLMRNLGGLKMEIKITRGNTVEKTVNTPDVKKSIGKPAVAKYWRTKTKCNDATGVSSDRVKIELRRGNRTVVTDGVSNTTTTVYKEEFDFKVETNRRHIETEVVDLGVKEVPVKETTVEEVTKKEPMVEVTLVEEPVVEAQEEKESVKEEIEDSKTMEPEVVEVSITDPIVEEEIEKEEETPVVDAIPVREYTTTFAVDATFDEEAYSKALDEIKEKKNPTTVEDTVVVEEVVHITVSNDEGELEPAAYVNTKEKKSTKKTSKKVEVSDPVDDDGSRPAKKKKATTSKKKTAAKKKVEEPVVVEEEVVEEAETIDKVKDVNDDGSYMMDLMEEASKFESPTDEEPDVIAGMVERGEAIEPELIRRSNTRVTVDDILNNY